MPAAGWLAVGAVAAALGAPVAGPLATLLVAAAAVSVVFVAPIARVVRRRGLALSLGAAAVALRLVVLPAPPPVAAPIPEGSGPWLATVAAVGAVRDGNQVATLRVLEPELLVAATLPRFPEIEPGVRIEVGGSIRAPPEGPYGDYLRRTGVVGTLRSQTLEVRPSERDAAALLERLRRAAGESLAAAIPEPQAGLAAGIVVGLRDRVDRDLAADFTTVGASHVVAISGWNIAIVAASVAALGGTLARRRRAALSAIAIGAYVLFAGASPSVVRAAAMAGVVLVARESGRAGHAAAALGLAAAILLLADPRIVTDAGFQLSTLATAGILVWATPLTARIGRLASGRLPGWIVECLAVSLAAQASTLPVVLGAFGRLAIVSPAVNLAIVPLVAPAMAACAVALAGGAATVAGAPAVVATLAGLPAWFLLSLITGAVGAFARLPFASVTLEPPLNLVGATAAAAVPAGVIWLRRSRSTSRRRGRSAPWPADAGPAKSVEPATRRRPSRAASASVRLVRRAVAIAVVGSFLAVGLAVGHRPDGATRITILDVGQGDAILVEGGRGGRMLVDGGPDPDRLLIELDRRLPPWDRRIDALVLTHPHEDHVAGLALLLARYDVGQVFEPGMRGPGPGYAEWSARLARTDAPRRGRLFTGDRIAVDDLAFRVLWPDPGRVPTEPGGSGRSINDVSIVLLGEVDGRRILLTGDVEDDVDPILASRGLPPVDLLKVAHHGSGTASTVAFLDVVRPTVAVISAGADNPYGHPARTTVEHLRARASAVHRTDTDGSVEVAFGGGRMTVRASGARTAGLRSPLPAASSDGIRLASAVAVAGPTGVRPPRPSPFACAVPSSG